MNKVLSLFARAAERQTTVAEQIASAERRYNWWFDHPIDWEQPKRTLYVTGWCVSRKSKEIRAVRARIGRQKFAGNYGIEREDVGAAFQRIGFAIAIPLPAGKAQIVIEVQEADLVWRPISSRAVFGNSRAESQPPVDPKYFIHNPGANPRIEFWIDRPLVWPGKIRHLKITGWCLAISGEEITEVRARVRNYGSGHPGCARPRPHRILPAGKRTRRENNVAAERRCSHSPRIGCVRRQSAVRLPIPRKH